MSFRVSKRGSTAFCLAAMQPDVLLVAGQHCVGGQGRVHEIELALRPRDEWEELAAQALPDDLRRQFGSTEDGA